MKKIEVVAAIIRNINGEIFCAQRSDHGEIGLKWEFPGGKIEPGETREEALIREIDEELDTVIQVLDHVITVNHTYESFELTMHAYNVVVTKGDLVLKEHNDSCWKSLDELYELDWAPADLPIIKKIMD